jgi:hypothetical protein
MSLGGTSAVSICALALLLPLAGCSSASKTPPIDLSSEPNGATAPPTTASCTADQEACNNLAFCGPQAFVTLVTGNPPAQDGGTIAAGIYTLDSYVEYTGPGGPAGADPQNDWAMQTLQLTATSETVSSIVWSDVSTTNLTAGSYAGNGAAYVSTGFISFNLGCGNSLIAGATGVAYTATPTTLQLILPGNGQTSLALNFGLKAAAK